MVSFLLRPLYHTDKRLGGPQSPPGQCGVQKITYTCLESNPGPPDHSPWLYRLSYPGSCCLLGGIRFCRYSSWAVGALIRKMRSAEHVARME
jgi:hypothetical protein